MSRPPQGATDGITGTCPNVTTVQRVRPKTASVSANSADRQTILPDVAVDDATTIGKRFSMYPVQRRGSRKKTLSLNPEEREALENLIEEVIMGGVGEGVIDSDASSSDDDADDQSPSSTQNSIPGSLAGMVAIGDAARQDTYVKGGKKFYPGQLKVALKHMHDLPPRFVRKLAKAQQYLDAGGIVSSKPAVGVGRIDEEEETTAQSKDDTKRPKAAVVAATTTYATNVPSLERDRDRTRVKENKLKDAKKMIRTLLTDRDQYVDEGVNSATASNQSNPAATDDVFQAVVSTSSSDHKPQSISPYHQHDTAPRQIVTESAAMSVGETAEPTYAASLSSIVTCTSSTCGYHSAVRGNVSNRVTEHVSKTSDPSYRTSHQSPNQPVIGSQPIPAQPFASLSPGIPQYQLDMPVVHGVKPAPVLSQSPPGTQFWIPQTVVPSNAPGYYGSSPPVVGMTGVPSAFSQPVPYAYSIQSSYPTVQGVHASYTPQYVYSASPPNQSLVAQPYSIAAAAAAFSQPVSYPVTILQPDQYVMSAANFYQNTPPPGYCPPQSRPTYEQRPIFAGDVPPPPVDGARKHMLSPSNYIHSSSALTVPVTASYKPLNSSIDTRSGYIKPVNIGSVGNSVSSNLDVDQKCSPAMRPRSLHTVGRQSSDIGAKIVQKIMPQMQQSSPGLASALNGPHPRFSKSPINVSSSNPCTAKSISHSMPNLSKKARPQSPRAAEVAVSKASSSDSTVVDKTNTTAPIEHPEMEPNHGNFEPSNFQCTDLENFSPPISDASILSDGQSTNTVSEGYSCDTEGCDAQADFADSSELSQPCAATLMSDTGNPLAEKSDLCISRALSVQPVIDPSISGTATMLSVSAFSAGVDIVDNKNNDVTCSLSINRTSDCLGESIKHSNSMDSASAEDHSASVSELSCSFKAETPSTSSSSQSSSVLVATVVAEAADISLDDDATCVSSSSDLFVTLSSSLRSALVDMFGPAAESTTNCGTLLLSAHWEASFCSLTLLRIIFSQQFGDLSYKNS